MLNLLMRVSSSLLAFPFVVAIYVATETRETQESTIEPTTQAYPNIEGTN